MDRLSGHERRRSQRFRVSSAIKKAELTTSFASSEGVRVLRGTIRDISVGGLCLQSNHTLKQSQVVRCDLFISRLQVTIPTLMKVRWVRENPKTRKYTIGLQY